MKYRMFLFVLFLLSFTTHSEMNVIENNPTDKENRTCPDWMVTFNELNKHDNSIISVKSKGDYNAQIPENSLRSFEISYSKCRPAIEIPVRFTKDKHSIIFNDTHIERMTQPGYNPETGENANPTYKGFISSEVSNLSLSEIKGLNLININGEITDFKIPTLEEFIKNYVEKKPGTLVFIYPRDLFTLQKTIKTIDEAIDTYGDKTLASRFIIKVDMAEVPQPLSLFDLLYNEKLKHLELLNFNPVLTYKAFNLFNKTGSDSVESLISRWLKEEKISVPVVDLELKNEQTDVTDNSMYKLVQVVNSFNKKVGVYVPVPDYIIWRKQNVSGFTVNHSLGDKRPVDIMTAFYNEDGSCCFVLKDKLSPGEHDMRMNLGWQKSVGGVIFTSLDTDTIDSYFKSQGFLNSQARPVPSNPVYAMKSGISWLSGYFVKPNHSSITLQESNSNKCLYGKAYQPGYMKECNDDYANDLGFNDKLLVKMAGENFMYIYDPATNFCLTPTESSDTSPAFWRGCVSESRWVRHGNDTIESYTYPGVFITSNGSVLHLKMLPVLNRWTYPE
ncbi:hypothetical protein NT945_004057 [Salmonella enterica]|nr:hypothetical protein [Salmonella enterica]ECC3883438.1 hypothetical protein [Salmonella enterica subsp. diarizonae]EIE2749534.1 hypothetical protein [Salmonella enterica subsp. diarizonae serovar 48:i:z]ECJ4780231.1 hypothetical protein [Salmonella enterica subsp. diarizonae]EDQ7408552.1 hypothetical protein [Salmonella enterica subsp. diarizonae]